MGGGGKKRRIEPSFDAPERGQRGSRADPDKRKPAPRRNKRKNRRKARGRGFVGLARRMVYWSFVLAIWGGIGIAGVVVYYGSQLPSASTWADPGASAQRQDRLRQ